MTWFRTTAFLLFSSQSTRTVSKIAQTLQSDRNRSHRPRPSRYRMSHSLLAPIAVHSTARRQRRLQRHGKKESKFRSIIVNGYRTITARKLVEGVGFGRVSAETQTHRNGGRQPTDHDFEVIQTIEGGKGRVQDCAGRLRCDW